MSKKKKPKRTETPSPSKKPQTPLEPDIFYQQKPAWRISQIVIDDVYGWEILDAQKLIFIQDKLSNFESMTWSEILIKGKKFHHLVKIENLSAEAKDYLDRVSLDDVDELVSLRLSGKERVWGILDENILNLLWWDPEHQVCPSLKKHT